VAVEEVTHVPVVGIQELPDKDLEVEAVLVLVPRMPVLVAVARAVQAELD
jgi:hypothetical protein